MSGELLEDSVTTLLCTREQVNSAVKLIAARHLDCALQREIASTKMLEVLLGEKTTAEASSRSIVSKELLTRYVSDAIFFLKWIIDGLDRITV
ncbi:hypothetical protein AAVH_29760 [Aphelenchoides avenae]|nr:hypothetical protein AAVH_33188 [Aphelenchus avenae]KAH7703076.1 hypothetical protein AAVH_29760 [Aphelenchus avenae]